VPMPSSSAGFCRPSGKVELSSLCGLGGVVIRGPHSTELVPNCLVVTECHGRISRSVSVTGTAGPPAHWPPERWGRRGKGKETKREGNKKNPNKQQQQSEEES